MDGTEKKGNQRMVSPLKCTKCGQFRQSVCVKIGVPVALSMATKRVHAIRHFEKLRNGWFPFGSLPTTPKPQNKTRISQPPVNLETEECMFSFCFAFAAIAQTVWCLLPVAAKPVMLRAQQAPRQAEKSTLKQTYTHTHAQSREDHAYPHIPKLGAVCIGMSVGSRCIAELRAVHSSSARKMKSSAAAGAQDMRPREWSSWRKSLQPETAEWNWAMFT